MIIGNFAVIFISLLLPVTAHSALPCPPTGYTTEQLLEIRQVGFVIDDAEQRDALVLGLLGCVSEPDPAIRDGVAFEGISKWLRAGEVSAETLQALFRGLLEQITNTDDPDGFQQPFAALILSEVARTDRIEPWLSDRQREELVGVAAAYLRGVTDYRGFSETEGWRHGVAHGSDLVLQLALNPQIESKQIKTLMDAVATQVSPPGEVFYVYGEPGRLARAVFYAHRRGELDGSTWEMWFEGLANPAPFDGWSAMYSSQTGLAKRHNMLAFLMAIHLNAVAADGELATELANIAMHALEGVLGG